MLIVDRHIEMQTLLLSPLLPNGEILGKVGNWHKEGKTIFFVLVDKIHHCNGGPSLIFAVEPFLLRYVFKTVRL